jgi:hypothetical protein
MDKETAASLAKALAVTCVRNTSLETIHAGKVAQSQAGDYSDVKVVTPAREIPWNELSRISDEEMKRLMKEVVNKLYTVLIHLDDEAYSSTLIHWGAQQTVRWDRPESIPNFILPD